MYYSDVDDGTIQMDLKSITASSNSSNLDVMSDDSSHEDIRSLSDRPVSCRGSPIEVSEFSTTEVKKSREETPTPEAD